MTKVKGQSQLEHVETPMQVTRLVNPGCCINHHGTQIHHLRGCGSHIQKQNLVSKVFFYFEGSTSLDL